MSRAKLTPFPEFPLLDRAVNQTREPVLDRPSVERFVHNPAVRKKTMRVLKRVARDLRDEFLLDEEVEILRGGLSVMLMLGIWLGQQGLASFPEQP